MYIYMYIYIYIYIYTHIYTHVCIYLDALKVLIAQGLAALLRDMTRSSRARCVHMRNSSFLWDMTPTWLNTYRRGTSSAAWHYSLIWDVTRSYLTCFVHISLDSLICVLSRSYGTLLWRFSFIWDVTRWYVSWHVHMGHDSHDKTTRLWGACSATAWRDFFTWDMTRLYVTCLVHTGHARSYTTCLTWHVHAGHS